MVRVSSLVFAATIVACAGATQSTSTTAETSGGGWKELAIAWDFGPCPNDGRSCHQLLTVNYEGGFIASEGGPSDSERRFTALDAQEVRELHRIVTADFIAHIGSFRCVPEYDATIRIDIDGHKQEVGGCVRQADGRENAPRALVEMLEHHRFASHDAPSKHPTAPSGQGDPCNTATGCASGLTCVVSPCVVAPCTSGSCQKL